MRNIIRVPPRAVVLVALLMLLGACRDAEQPTPKAPGGGGPKAQAEPSGQPGHGTSPPEYRADEKEPQEANAPSAAAPADEREPSQKEAQGPANPGDENADLYPVFMQTEYGYLDALYGYVDRTGKVVIEPQFTDAGKFSEGLASVRVGGSRDQWGLCHGGKYGFIDNTGKLVIEAQFEWADSFTEGIARVKVEEKWGCIDRSGDFVAKPQFDIVRPFSEGLAQVKVKEHCGYIDRSGKMAIESRFSDVGRFAEGLARVKLEEKWGYIDRSGKMVIESRFSNAGTFSEGLAQVKVEEKWGYIDPSGDFVAKPQFDEARHFSEGLAHVKVEEKWGYIDPSGDFVAKPQFDEVRQFSEGLAQVKVEEKWGYIDRSGNMVIEPQFDRADGFSDGLAKVGKETAVPSLATAEGVPWNLTIHIRNVYGYVDTKGRMVIEPKFEGAGSFSNGIAWVSIGAVGKAGYTRKDLEEAYIDKTGNYVWDPATKVELELSDTERLFRQLCASNLKEHFAAAESLVKVGKPVVPGLLEYLRHHRWYVVVTTAWVLGEIKDPQAVEPLVAMLKSKEKIGPPAYTSYVGDMSFRPQKEMSLYNTPGTFPSWNLLFERRAAAIALGKIGDKRAIPALIAVLKDWGGSEVKSAAVETLKKTTGKDFGNDEEKWLEWWEKRIVEDDSGE